MTEAEEIEGSRHDRIAYETSSIGSSDSRNSDGVECPWTHRDVKLVDRFCVKRRVVLRR